MKVDPALSPIDWYTEALKGDLRADPSQSIAILHLQALHVALKFFKSKRHRPLGKWLPMPDLPRGLYFWGGVGTGKTLLMDVFFETLPYRRKGRMHFHAFMRAIHAQLGQLKGVADPLERVAADLARRYRVLCLDEFHVSDIADAMILGRLLQGLWSRGVVLLLTSNYPPSGLYPDGLQRERFLPAITLIEQSMDALLIDHGVDYRQRGVGPVPAYLCPNGKSTHRQLMRVFANFTMGEPLLGQLTIDGRDILPLRMAPDIVWFDFDVLIKSPRSQRDYLEITERFGVLILSDVPQMDAAMAAEARRFTWLIDVCYDRRIHLYISAAVPAGLLYVDGVYSGEFKRTVSRLEEMRSMAYLAQPPRVSQD